MNTISGFAKKYELPGFFLLANLFSWALGILLALQAIGWCEPVFPFSMHYLYAFGPTLAALMMTGLVDGAEGMRELFGRISRWRVGWAWWVVAFSPLWLYGLIVIAQGAITGAWTDLTLLGQVKFLPQLKIGVAIILWVLTYGLGEEIGWRGYALPRMQRSHSALSATLLLSALWAIWHWPLFFYVLDIAILPMWLIGLAAGTIVFTWLYNSSGGSVLMIILWHGFYDFITASKAGEGLGAIILSAIVMVWAVLVVLLYKPARLSPGEKHVI